jgi:hypothetical protein
MCGWDNEVQYNLGQSFGKINKNLEKSDHTLMSQMRREVS